MKDKKVEDIQQWLLKTLTTSILNNFEGFYKSVLLGDNKMCLGFEKGWIRVGTLAIAEVQTSDVNMRVRWGWCCPGMQCISIQELEKLLQLGSHLNQSSQPDRMFG